MNLYTYNYFSDDYDGPFEGKLKGLIGLLYNDF